MARRIEKLTHIGISKIKKPGYYGDGAGLWLQVSASGSKSWIFRYTIAGRQREMGLGSQVTLGLADARIKAKECRQLLLDGKDPIDERIAIRKASALSRAKAMIFDQCSDAYIDAHRSEWKNEKHIAQWKNTLTTYASPVIGQLPISEVTTPLVVKILSPIWKRKTETATRLRGRIEKVLDWATVAGYREGENPARWRGHLENLLAKPNKLAKVVHHPALPWKEIGRFMTALRKQPGNAARALEFAILTAARSGEVRNAAWDEIDTAGALWTVPGERMKMGKEHRVPLSSAALKLLESLPREGTLLFPGSGKEQALSDMTLTAVIRRMHLTATKAGRTGWKDPVLDRTVTAHGFRSTFRDWTAEATSFPREICEHALAHSLPDRVEASYRRTDLLDKRVALMQSWADCCSSPTERSTEALNE